MMLQDQGQDSVRVKDATERDRDHVVPARDRERFVHGRAPVNVYWETTIACDLACKHCRASAIPERSPDELTTGEALTLLEDVRDMGSTLIFTGGDPLRRPDLFDLLSHAREIGLSVGVTPAATPRLTRDVVGRFVESGIAMMGMSLDGGNALDQDGFRGVSGTFERTLQALDWAGELGLGVQINTTVTRHTAAWLPEIFDRLAARAGRPVRRWSLFFLIPTGRGASVAMPTREQVEEVFAWVRERSPGAGFQMTTVEAPQYRRFFLERELAGGSSWEAILSGKFARGLGIRDGNGIVFVSRCGDVLPSGFLPVSPLGNVKDSPLSSIYRSHELLLSLRDPDRFRGACGDCAYRWVCGGSRARAYAMTGDVLGPDPLCPFPRA